MKFPIIAVDKMKFRQLAIPILATLLSSGCVLGKKRSPNPGTAQTIAGTNNISKTDLKLIVTPETALIGKVAAANANARFVVLNFPVGRLPSLDQRLNVYRNGLKVGEVKTTGPQRDDNTVADIIAGEARVGDEVREN